MKRKQKAFCPLNEIVNPDICCLSQVLAWNAWQVGLCYNDKLIHIRLWSQPEKFSDINFQSFHLENQDSLWCLQFLITKAETSWPHYVWIVRLGWGYLGLSQLSQRKAMLVHGENPTEGGSLADLRPVLRPCLSCLSLPHFPLLSPPAM